MTTDLGWQTGAVELFGVINASPDSLNVESRVDGADQARARAKHLLESGADYIDIGGAGSTGFASRVDIEQEWQRLVEPIRVLSSMDVEFSVDTWQPEIAHRGFEAGATWMNAADGLQNPEMVELAALTGCQVVLPFLSGENPLALTHVGGDPISAIGAWFDNTIRRVVAAGVDRDQLVLDPGTGFGPADWAWDDRYEYQKAVYSRLAELRSFDLPLYIALPWKETSQHDELLEIVLRFGVEYGRAHFPAKVRAMEGTIRRVEP